jgi:hypothetical protein
VNRKHQELIDEFMKLAIEAEQKFDEIKSQGKKIIFPFNGKTIHCVPREELKKYNELWHELDKLKKKQQAILGQLR